MPLLAQWTRQRPWLAAGLTGAASGVVGIAGGLATFAGTVGAMALGGISTRATAHEHPLRRRILSTLEARPGLCYRGRRGANGPTVAHRPLSRSTNDFGKH